MWPFQKNQKPFNSWPIVRTKPNGKKYGRAIQLFINNWQCHLTTVDVYSDGAVDCWGFVDLNLFRQKLRSRWVVPSPPKVDQQISVFHFGMTGFRNAEWNQTSTFIEEEVNRVVKSLNPQMKDLIDMQGTDTEARGKVRYAKMGLSDQKPYRAKPDHCGELLGKSVSVLRVLPDAFELTNLFIFSDGLIQVGSEPVLHPLNAVESLYKRAVIANAAPKGSKIVVPGLGSFETTSNFGGISTEDRIMELHDMHGELQGKPSGVKICADAFSEYEKSPSAEKREILRKAYEQVPEHLRCYCGDMDTRDTAIQKVLYGKDEVG